VIGAVAGGLLMGYGARLAMGCNIGALFSGTASLSLHGWVFWLFLIVGAYVGSQILVRYLKLVKGGLRFVAYLRGVETFFSPAGFFV